MSTAKLPDMSDVTVIINGTHINGVTFFDCEETSSLYDIKTFGEDRPIAQVPLNNTYTVKLTVYGDICSQTDITSYELNITAGIKDNLHTYTQCKVLKYNIRSDDDNKVYTDITLSALRRN